MWADKGEGGASFLNSVASQSLSQSEARSHTRPDKSAHGGRVRENNMGAKAPRISGRAGTTREQGIVERRMGILRVKRPARQKGKRFTMKLRETKEQRLVT